MEQQRQKGQPRQHRDYERVMDGRVCGNSKNGNPRADVQDDEYPVARRHLFTCHSDPPRLRRSRSALWSLEILPLILTLGLCPEHDFGNLTFAIAHV